VRAAAALLAEGDPSVVAPISAVPPVSVTGADVAELGANLLRMISAYSSMLEVWALPAPWAVTPGEYPRLSTWAQHELRASPFVTNLRHERVRLDTLEAAVARLLDGTHTAADICAALEPAVRSGAIVLQGEARRAEGAEAPPLSAADAVALLPKAVAERLVLLTVYGLITRDV
jgi:hypothetical protein